MSTKTFSEEYEVFVTDVPFTVDGMPSVDSDSYQVCGTDYEGNTYYVSKTEPRWYLEGEFSIATAGDWYEGHGTKVEITIDGIVFTDKND